MKVKNKYIGLSLFLILYFLLEFIINFIIIKLLGGYDNKINYDLSVIYSRLIILLIVGIVLNKKLLAYIKFKSVSLKKILMIVLGSILYSAIVVFIKNQNIAEYGFHWSQNYNIYLISAIIVAPFYEEIFYRGLPAEYLLRKNISPTFIIILTSILFGITHLPSVNQMFYATIIGLITFWIYTRERNLIYPIIFHLVYNFIVLCIY